MNSNHVFYIWKWSLTITLALILLQAKAWTVTKAPVNMLGYASLVGKKYCFSVTGYDPNVGAESFWGDLIYTAISPISSSAAYEGWVRPGEQAQVAVLVVAGQSSYNSSTRNGMTSAPYNLPWSLSYSYVDYCCKDGQFNTYRSPTCSACKTGCLLCSGSADNCQSCAEGYGFYSSTCRQCVGEYYSGPTSPCSTCKLGCQSCNSANTAICLACEPGYYFHDSQCFKCPAGTTNNGGTENTCDLNCPPNCQECKDPDTCLQCPTQYILYNYTLNLIETNQAKQVLGCARCPSNCDLCADVDTCLTCHSDSVFVNKLCRKCGIGSYSDGATCVTCGDAKCVKCQSTEVCNQCINGYVVTPNRTSCVLDGLGTGFPEQAIIIISIVAGLMFTVVIFVTAKYVFSATINKHKLE